MTHSSSLNERLCNFIHFNCSLHSGKYSSFSKSVLYCKRINYCSKHSHCIACNPVYSFAVKQKVRGRYFPPPITMLHFNFNLTILKLLQRNDQVLNYRCRSFYLHKRFSAKHRILLNFANELLSLVA